MDRTRLDNFAGSDEQYVDYLEIQVLNYRNPHYPLQITPPHSPTLESQACQLEFSQFDPLTIPSTKKPRQWEKEIDTYLADVPPITLWERRRQSLELVWNHDIGFVLATLLNGDIPNRTFAPQDTSPVICSSPLLQRAHTFAISTNHMQKKSKLLTNICHFRGLLFGSLCAVLVKTGIRHEDVDPIMKVCLKERNFARYRSGAVWANRQMSALISCGWANRATELFLICKNFTFQSKNVLRVKD
jgi:hypothetical protein